MGAIKDQLRADLTAAMKARDELKKSTIRMALAAIQYAEVAGDEATELDDAAELKVLTKERNNRLESAKTYAEAGRSELAEQEAAEAEILEAYLPKPLTEEELEALVDAEVARVTAELGTQPTMKEMGSLVKAVNAKAAGRADGKTVATLVRQRLA